MWVKFAVISQGRDLNDGNNENQHLRVVLMAKNIETSQSSVLARGNM